MKTWIQSYTGRQVTPLDLKPEQVCIEDIAHALSQKTRFTGQCSQFYSVAQHCVIGSEIISPAFALPFLLHEVSEAYLPDIAAPLKPFVYVNLGGQVTPWKELEHGHAEVVLEALGLSSLLPLLTSPQVREMDLRMLMTEARDLLGPPPAPWGIDAKPFDTVQITPWDPSDAEDGFLSVFRRLTEVEP